MLNMFNFARFRRQAPTTRPPKGYYDLRVSKSTGALVLVDEDGSEAAVGSVTSVAGRTGAVTLAQADIDGLQTSDLPVFAGLAVQGAASVSDSLLLLGSVNCLTDVSVGENLGLQETTTPSAVASKAKIYAEDNGSGKTRVMALFQTGAAQQIAIEP